MKWTPVLYAHHIGRRINKKWFLYGKIVVNPTNAEETLKNHGYEVVDINDVLYPFRKREKKTTVDVEKKSHKHLNVAYGDSNVLLEGVRQAKVLTNTVEISEGLPDAFLEKANELSIPDDLHSEVKKRIMLSSLLEATQVKLPKRKDPQRPAWIFPRDYGIDAARKIELICKNFIQICDVYSNNKEKSVVFKPFFSVGLEAHNKNIQMEMTSELVVTSSRELSKLAEPSCTQAIDLINLHPLECTVSLTPANFTALEDFYPFSETCQKSNVHTAFLAFDPTVVKNLYEEEVLSTQFESRSLIKGFCVAAAKARSVYGKEVKQLPKPLVVPVVQTDSKMFHFTVFQLNTLDLNSEVKNIFWNSDIMPLYEVCEYIDGKPILEGYNPDVIKNIMLYYDL